jgi:hypothetical protein
MTVLYIAIIALAAGFAAYLSVRALRGAPGAAAGPLPDPEAMLLQEAVITRPVAPGMEGGAEIRKPGSRPLALRVRANDASQAFARGTRVRVIDCRDGCCFIESVDEVHLVR